MASKDKIKIFFNKAEGLGDLTLNELRDSLNRIISKEQAEEAGRAINDLQQSKGYSNGKTVAGCLFYIMLFLLEIAEGASVTTITPNQNQGEKLDA